MLNYTFDFRFSIGVCFMITSLHHFLIFSSERLYLLSSCSFLVCSCVIKMTLLMTFELGSINYLLMLQHHNPVSFMTTSQLMELPPTALLNGLLGFHSTKMYYPMPILDLHMGSIQLQHQQASLSSIQGCNATLQAFSTKKSMDGLIFLIFDCRKKIRHLWVSSIHKQREISS